MAVLSLQSSVAYGHVGNAAAAFCLGRVGCTVWPVDTVAFSNHPGYGTFGGRVRPAADVAAIVDGLDRLGVLAGCQAVLSGYLGSAENGRVVVEAVTRVKARNPRALYCCDPVMGDRAPGLYVSADVVACFRQAALPAADILVPNHFELEVLAGRPLATLADVLAAAVALIARGPELVVVTSLATADLAGDRIATAAITQAGAWRVTTPRLPLRAHGTGDAFAALFLARVLAGAAPAEALAAAVSAVYAVIETTVAADAPELCLIAAQDRLVDPPTRFTPDRFA